MKNTKVPNRKFWTFFLCDRILKHNLHVYSYPVNNEEKNETKRRCCFSDNVAVCGMAQFFCFRRKCKNRKLKIAINFQFLFFAQNIQNL